MSEVPEAFPVQHRSTPMDFETWKKIVLAVDTKYVAPHLLARLYHKGWDAVACIEYLRDMRWYEVPPIARPTKQKYHRLTYDSNFIAKRIALAIWRECNRLLVKRLTADAMRTVLETKAEMEARLRD